MHDCDAIRPGAFWRWGQFLRERFPLPMHLAMIIVFWGGNVAIGHFLVAPATRQLPFFLGFFLCVLFFFRMRVFDEIKDYATDCELHPERPLARGLIDMEEAKAMAVACLAVEGILAVLAGWPVFLAWLLAATFSGLMYREFFCGAWLRPKMELYAVTHTFVAVLLGQLAMVAATGIDFWRLGGATWLAVLGNWGVFNVYEFARKTYAPDEEIAGVESYSRRWGPLGAGTLSLLNAAAACTLLIGTLELWRHGWLMRPAAVWWICALVTLELYWRRPIRRSARLFRAVMTAFLLGYYLLPIAYGLLPLFQGGFAR